MDINYWDNMSNPFYEASIIIIVIIVIILIIMIMFQLFNLVGGFNPFEKYEFVSWDDDIFPTKMESHKIPWFQSPPTVITNHY